MAYNKSRNPQPNSAAPPDPGQIANESPGVGDFLDVGRSGLAGLRGKDHSQWQREQKRKKRGLPPASTPNRNWLQRLMNFK